MSLSFLSSIDFFSIFPGFFVKRDLDYKTKTGGFITILIIIATIILAIIFSQELFIKKNPTVSTALKVSEHPDYYQYPYPIFFMLVVRDTNDNPIIDPSIYYAKARIYKLVLNDNGKIGSKKISINLKRCDEILNENFQYYELIKDIDLQNHYCLDNSNNDLSIGEFWGNENFQMLQVKMYKCNFTNEANGCKNENEIDNFLSKASVQIYSIKNYLNSNDHKNPLNTGIEENFYYLLRGYHTTVFHYLRELEIKDDNGLIFEEENIIKSFTVDSQENYINSDTDEDNKKFFSFAIQLTNTKEIYSRSYFKLQDLGAQVSSFYSIFMVVGSIILKFYHKSEYCLDLLNEFFEIDVSNINNSNKISNELKKVKNSNHLIGRSTIDDLYSKKSNEEINFNPNKMTENSINISKNSNEINDIKYNIPTDNSDSDYIKNIPINHINNNDINANKHSNFLDDNRYKSSFQKSPNYSRKTTERRVNYNESDRVFSTPRIQRSDTKNSRFISDNFRGKLKNLGTLNAEKLSSQPYLKNENINEEEKIKDISSSEKSFDIDKMLKECQEKSGKIKLSIWDRLIGIEFCDKCKRKNSKFYKSYYLGEEFFLQTLEVSIFLKDMNTQSNFVKFYLTEGQYKIFRYVSQPVLNVDYVGTRYNRDNIPDDLAKKLGFQKE